MNVTKAIVGVAVLESLRDALFPNGFGPSTQQEQMRRRADRLCNPRDHRSRDPIRFSGMVTRMSGVCRVDTHLGPNEVAPSPEGPSPMPHEHAYAIDDLNLSHLTLLVLALVLSPSPALDTVINTECQLLGSSSLQSLFYPAAILTLPNFSSFLNILTINHDCP